MDTERLVIVVIILLSVACKNSVQKIVPPEVVRVRVGEVVIDSLSIPVHTNGILGSSEEMKLSFKTGGIVEKIFVREGERVRKGESLATLNLSEISANAEQAKNGYHKALRDYQRAENLFRDSIATLEQKQNAETALNVAKSTYDIVQFNLLHSKITAPDNGVIMKQFVKENELVAQGYPVFLFGSSGKYWKVDAGVSDKDIIKINTGDSASVSFDAWPGIKFSAVVDQVGEMSNPYTGTYETQLIFNKTSYRLASGFVASVDIFPSAKRSFSLIPVGCIVEADGYEGYIYLISGGDTVKRVRIEIATIVGSMAAVKGIPEGYSTVVTEGVAYLKPGMKVIVIK